MPHDRPDWLFSCEGASSVGEMPFVGLDAVALTTSRHQRTRVQLLMSTSPALNPEQDRRQRQVDCRRAGSERDDELGPDRPAYDTLTTGIRLPE